MACFSVRVVTKVVFKMHETSYSSHNLPVTLPAIFVLGWWLHEESHGKVVH